MSDQQSYLAPTFHNYKLLQELDDEIVIIISNANNLEIFPIIKFIWEQHHQQAFVATVRLIH